MLNNYNEVIELLKVSFEKFLKSNNVTLYVFTGNDCKYFNLENLDYSVIEFIQSDYDYTTIGVTFISNVLNYGRGSCDLIVTDKTVIEASNDYKTVFSYLKDNEYYEMFITALNVAKRWLLLNIERSLF